MITKIDKLLKDVKIDKERVKKSIYTILDMYGLEPKDVSITRRNLNPSEIFVAASEECNLENAKKIMKQKYQNVLPAPITILQYKNKNVLFMGSNRSIIFILKGKIPNSIVVKIPDVIKEHLYLYIQAYACRKCRRSDYW